jgi:hypothetical protein
VDRGKVDALKASIRSTSFWGNVVARKVGRRAQLAYGHHRKVALDETYGPDHEVDLIVRDLDDATMLRIMANDNMEEYGTNPQVEQETVRAVVLAYADGAIELDKPKYGGRGGGVRIAPGFRVAKTWDGTGAAYNAESVALFLSGGRREGVWWHGKGDKAQVSPRVRNALLALEANEEVVEESGESFDEVTEDLGSNDAKEMAYGYKRLRREHEKAGVPLRKAREEAVKDTKEIADKLRKRREEGRKRGEPDGGSVRGVRDEFTRRINEISPKPLPDVDVFCKEMAADLHSLVSLKDKRWNKLQQLVECRADVHPDDLEEVALELEALSKRCADIARQLRAPVRKQLEG